MQVLDGDDASSSSGDSDFGDKVQTYLSCTCSSCRVLSLMLCVLYVVGVEVLVAVVLFDGAIVVAC